jgi:acyl carrier protein
VDDVGAAKRALALAQASVWGFTRVVEFEYPELHPTLLDLDPAAARDEETELVCAELLASPSEEEIAYRDGRAWVAQLERPPVLAAEPPEDVPRALPERVRKDGTYLVTGGLGDLGLAAAGWLAAEGAGRIVLMGRSGATTAEQGAVVQALRDRGADIAVAQGDIGHRADLDRVLAEHVTADRPLRGVLHAAVVVDDALLATLTWPRIENVFVAKVLGAWNLHQATRGLALDWFVLYASAVGFIGAPGQANYAAANSFLDALAHHRRALGLHALSIDWTAFRDTPKQALTARLSHRGFGSLTPGEGIALLDRLLREDATQRAALPLDVRQWKEFYPHIVQSTRYARLLNEPASRTAVQRVPAAWTQGSASERRQALAAVVREQLGHVLRIAGERIEPRAPFRSLGLDSLMSLELRNRLEATLGLTLGATITWAHPDLDALTNHLAERLGLTAPAQPAPPVDGVRRDEVDVAALRAEVSALSADGLLAELERELAGSDGDAPEHT